MPLPVPPMAEAPAQTSTPTGSEVPVVDVKPVYVVAQHESYKVDRTPTATRTDTPIMETPYSVQVIPQQLLRDQQAVRLETALQNVSGVTRFDGSIDGQDGYLIRGFETTAHYRNGVLRPNNHLVDTANIERVEVLKGPASILYGRADPGGIINIVTKQ
ncbi:MAG TPA: Plug domain-containing protein, partial [Nitrospira sp.]|nr:Plug domain-containing protein [Nitrospira sp.]